MGVEACCHPGRQLGHKLCAFFDAIVRVVLEQREKERLFLVGQHAPVIKLRSTPVGVVCVRYRFVTSMSVRWDAHVPAKGDGRWRHS